MTTQKKKSSKKSAPIKNPEKVRKGKNAVRKGKAFERDVANLLGHVFPEAKRNLEFQADEAIHSKDIAGTDVYKIQCKNYQNYVNPSVIFDVKLSSQEDVPVLVTKGNKLPPMAVLPLGDFISLLEIKYGVQPPKLSQSERGNSTAAMMAKSLPPFNTLITHDIAIEPEPVATFDAEVIDALVFDGKVRIHPESELIKEFEAFKYGPGEVNTEATRHHHIEADSILDLI